jgi:hypothetical protein
MQTVIERAEYKLQQADMALRHLRAARKDIAQELRRGRSGYEPNLLLDTFFFSCLGLAKSAYNIVKDAERGRFQPSIHSWRVNGLDHKGRTQFNRMMKLRDIDVHHGRSEGVVLSAMIPMERDVYDWQYQQQPNYAALGISRPMTEHVNPDGATASSYDGLQGTMALYIDVAGERCEASNACERFILQLRQMLNAVSAANVPPLSLFWRMVLRLQKCLGFEV